MKERLQVIDFHLSVPQATLSDLRDRLVRTRWTDTLDPGSWVCGTSLEYLKGLVDYWLTDYDWQGQELEINRWPHFELVIDGLGVHFLHVRGEGERGIPLLLTHGWPGSFLEMVKILPHLTRARRLLGGGTWSFDAVVPSLPGFGFSARPTVPGMNAWRTADLFAKLMSELGYERFLAQGGDFGASVGTALALRHPGRLRALHLNYIPGSYRPPLSDEAFLGLEEKEFQIEVEAWLAEQGAYAHVQSTRPQTLGLALNDTPVGLAAWLIEKYRGWSDCDNDIERRFSRDELITHIMVYWITETIHSSARYYFEMRRAPMTFQPGDFVQVPVGIARFPKEAPFPPRSWIARGYNVVRWSDMPRGGHFAAWEEPELLAEDVAAFVIELGLVSVET